MTSSISRCVSCGKDKLIKHHGDFTVLSQGKKVRVRNVDYYHCPRCGEEFMDLDNELKIDRSVSKRSTAAGIKK
jgi:YgiT-type zinc finger domain-containing protein